MALARRSGLPPVDEELIRLPHNGWAPRPYQQHLWNYLEQGGKRAVAIWHRRAGKDEVCLHWSAVAAHTRVGVYWHMLPEANQARKAIWDAVNPHTGQRRINEAFPRDIRETTRETDMAIRFKSGSLWQLVGSDNYNSLVGSPPVGIVFSEFALADPSSWGYLRPILAEANGWALFITTPRGRNHAATFFEAANHDPTWFAEQLPATETPVFTPEQLETEHRELLREYGDEDGEARYQTEYMVSFSAGVTGSFYGSLMEKAEKEHRITKVLHDTTLPVHTAWDLGIGDATAIWLVQLAGQEIRLIDFISNSGVGLDWYTRELDKRPYKWGEHVLPHDAEARELGSGRSRIEVLRSLGFHRTQVIAAQRVEDGINAVRMILPRCWFDAEKCAHGISALQQYRRAWNEPLRTYSDRPLHDWTSHACLRGDSLVKTARGEIAIRDVCVGDLAWTPAGWARVSAAGPVKIATEMLRLQMTDGRELVCTPEHKIMTQRGFVRADALRYSDRVFSGEEWQCRLSSWFSMASNTGFRAVITGGGITAGRDRATYIARSMRIIMDRYQKVATSIIAMATGSTTRLATSNALMLVSINVTMPLSEWPEASYSRPLPRRALGPPNGTAPTKDVLGMSSTAKERGIRTNGIHASVRNAVWRFIRLSLRAPNSATRIAELSPYGGGGELVFDLTVANHGCYQANGLMVSNSDALRYFALANVRNAGSMRPLKYPDLAVV